MVLIGFLVFFCLSLMQFEASLSTETIPFTRYVNVNQIPNSLKTTTLKGAVNSIACGGRCSKDILCHSFIMRFDMIDTCELLQGLTDGSISTPQGRDCYISTSFNGVSHAFRGTKGTWQENWNFCNSLGMTLPRHTENSIKMAWMRNLGAKAIGAKKLQDNSNDMYDIRTNQVINITSWGSNQPGPLNQNALILLNDGYHDDTLHNIKGNALCEPLY